MKNLKNYFPFLILAISVIQISCDESPTGPLKTPQRGDLVEVTSVDTIKQSGVELFLNQIPDEQNFDIEAQNDIVLVSLVYRTVDYNYEMVHASGLAVIPISNEAHPLISLHHGTQTDKENVGSVNAIYSFDAVIAGAIGYVAASPDYLGLGVSDGVHPYHHEKTSASVSIDMLKAVKEYCADNEVVLNDQLFLAGYSQGGYVTMAVHKEIEKNYSDEFEVTASAPMAGAYDLLLTADEILSTETYERPSFISFLTYSYNEIYEWSEINDIFKEPYAAKIPSLFNGTKTTAEIDTQLTTDLTDLFTGEFLGYFSGDLNNKVAEAFRQNSVLDWYPTAPIMLVHGDADNYVPYENAVNAKEQLQANGGEISLVTIEGGTHESSVLPAIKETINWIQTFRKGANKIALKNN